MFRMTLVFLYSVISVNVSYEKLIILVIFYVKMWISSSFHFAPLLHIKKPKKSSICRLRLLWLQSHQEHNCSSRLETWKHLPAPSCPYVGPSGHLDLRKNTHIIV